MLVLAAPALAQDKQPPYWASIASGQAMTHTGPGRNYPEPGFTSAATCRFGWSRYIETWRLIQDPDGAQGWMLVTMLSDRRTAIVKPGEPRAVRADRNEGAKVRYMAEPGVVGRIDKCKGDGWCRIEIGKKDGYVRTSDLWGVERERGGGLRLRRGLA